MMTWLDRFNAVWSIDFEFSSPSGERPSVACLVAREYHTKQLIRLARKDITNQPPFDLSESSLFVAYFASAEWNCFLSLGWELPTRTIDLWVEFKNQLNGLPFPKAGMGLLGCLFHHGLPAIGAEEKEAMRELAMRGGSYSEREMAELLDYCQSDVDALDRLLPVMAPNIDAPRALLRGRYMQAIARMEHCGIPIDTKSLNKFRNHWGDIKSHLVSEVDQTFGVYDGLSFKQDRFKQYLKENDIPWPHTPTWKLKLDDDTFRQQAKLYPQVSPLRELRHTMSELKLEKLEVGADGRNRTMLRPFASRSGRNQPSNNKFIFGPSVWIRGLIQPEKDRAIAYVDWSQQELGIAAALSADPAMSQAYASGDPYLEFARMADAVPTDATKQTHPQERAAYKVCMLAVQYGMTEVGLASKLNCSVAFARHLLQKHRSTFPVFWSWSQSQVDAAMLELSNRTVFGWQIQTTGRDNPRFLANFPMQANGAEMLRLACCLATEDGINVCCPIHDALLVEGHSSTMEQTVRRTMEHMTEASRVVLDGFELSADYKIVRWPDRYHDEDRGVEMWNRITDLASQFVE